MKQKIQKCFISWTDPEKTIKKLKKFLYLASLFGFFLLQENFGTLTFLYIGQKLTKNVLTVFLYALKNNFTI